MTAIVITTVIVLRMPLMNIKALNGKIKSKTTTSFVKRVRMRPIGFESKNTILALRTRSVTFRSMLDMLVKMTLNKAIARANDTNVNKSTSPAKTSG